MHPLATTAPPHPTLPEAAQACHRLGLPAPTQGPPSAHSRLTQWLEGSMGTQGPLPPPPTPSPPSNPAHGAPPQPHGGRWSLGTHLTAKSNSSTR